MSTKSAGKHRDIEFLEAFRDGRVNRASTFVDRKKRASKEQCRGRIS